MDPMNNIFLAGVEAKNSYIYVHLQDAGNLMQDARNLAQDARNLVQDAHTTIFVA